MANADHCLEMTEPELRALLSRLRALLPSDDDRQRLNAVFEYVFTSTTLLRTNGMTVRQLRLLLLGQRRSEKKRDLFGDGDRDRNAGAAPVANDAEPAVDDSALDEPSPVPPSSPDSGSSSNPKPKRKGHGRNGVDDYPGATKVEHRHSELKPGNACPRCQCGKVYEKAPRRFLRIVGQAPIEVTCHQQQTLRCHLCGELFRPELPATITAQKYDSSAIAIIVLLKYGSGFPWYRSERFHLGFSIPLPAGTQYELALRGSRIAQWIWKELIRRAAQAPLLHNDDTHMPVLALLEENKSRANGERTGMFTTAVMAIDGELRIALFFTGRQHAGENLRDVLKQRAADNGPPLQMCDGLNRNRPGDIAVITANCNVHARRQFVEVRQNFPDACRHVLEEIAKVYNNDAEARRLELTPQQRLEHHQATSGPVMERLKRWLEDKQRGGEVEPNSGLGRAIHYMLKRWDQLTLFLCVPGAPLDNNIVERTLKKVILHRKNALFYKTLRGAMVGDIFMSLIATCESNGVNALTYLTAVIAHPNEVEADPGAWLPWNYGTALEKANQAPAAPAA